MDESVNGQARMRRSRTASMALWCCCVSADDAEAAGEKSLLRSSWLQRSRRKASSGGGSGDEEHDNWWRKGWNSVRRAGEWSETVLEDAAVGCCSGPKWRHFVRRFKAEGRTIYNSRPGRFQYDPLSYQLNFDSGSHHVQDEMPLPGVQNRS